MNDKQFIDLFLGAIDTEKLEEFGIIDINNSIKRIQIYTRKSLLDMAKALGATVLTEDFKYEGYIAQSSFVYNGWVFNCVYKTMEE